jgi:hypothetical protein
LEKSEVLWANPTQNRNEGFTVVIPTVAKWRDLLLARITTEPERRRMFASGHPRAIPDATRHSTRPNRNLYLPQLMAPIAIGTNGSSHATSSLEEEIR